MTTPEPINQNSNGLSKAEQEWFQKNFNRLIKEQGEQLDVLNSIKTGVNVIVVVFVLAALVAGCTVIMSF